MSRDSATAWCALFQREFSLAIFLVGASPLSFRRRSIRPPVLQISGADASVAASFLGTANGNVELALSNFFDQLSSFRFVSFLLPPLAPFPPYPCVNFRCYCVYIQICMRVRLVAHIYTYIVLLFDMILILPLPPPPLLSGSAPVAPAPSRAPPVVAPVLPASVSVPPPRRTLAVDHSKLGECVLEVAKRKTRLPLTAQLVEAEVFDCAAEVTVTQRYVNNTGGPIEAVYRFFAEVRRFSRVGISWLYVVPISRL